MKLYLVKSTAIQIDEFKRQIITEEDYKKYLLEHYTFKSHGLLIIKYLLENTAKHAQVMLLHHV
jgi:uncharacterized protein YpiB (UPF0302 family)